MPRLDTPRYQAGDRLEDGRGSVGYVRTCNGVKGPYLKVFVAEGPRKNEWCWPERFGKPQLDWHPHGLAEVCGECDRPFKGKPTEKQVFCVQCTREQESADRNRASAEAHGGPATKFRRWVTPEMRQREAAEKQAAEIGDSDSPF